MPRPPDRPLPLLLTLTTFAASSGYVEEVVVDQAAQLLPLRPQPEGLTILAVQLSRHEAHTQLASRGVLGKLLLEV